MTYSIADGRSRVRHSRRHKARVVSLYLVVDTVGMRIVLPIARGRWHKAVLNVVTPCLVSVPERIASVCKGCGKGICRRIQPQTVKDIEEGKIHINIVEEAGRPVEKMLQMMLWVFNSSTFRNRHTPIAEFSRSAIGASYCLAGPSALNLIQECSTRESNTMCLYGCRCHTKYNEI